MTEWRLNLPSTQELSRSSEAFWGWFWLTHWVNSSLGCSFKFVGTCLFSNEWRGFIRMMPKGYCKLFHSLPPLRDKFSCNSQRINLAVLFTVPVGLTWVHWEFSYLHFMVLVNFLSGARIVSLSSEPLQVTAWLINISWNQWWFKITHYTTDCSSWEADCSLYYLFHRFDNQNKAMVLCCGQKAFKVLSA